MADYYTKSVVEIPLRSAGETHCLLAILDRGEEMADLGTDRDEPPHDPTDPFQYFDSECRSDGWGWSYRIAQNTALIFTEESGNVDALRIGLQIFLAKCREPGATMHFIWCNDCSKPRVGAFSGGGVVFSATESKQFDIEDVVREYEESLKKA